MFNSVLKKFFGNNEDYEVSFRVLDEDGDAILDTDDPEVFRAFLEKLDGDETADCGADCEECCQDMEDEIEVPCEGDYDACPYLDDMDDEAEIENEIIYEIPVSGVAAAAALIGSIALLVKALKKH